MTKIPAIKNKETNCALSGTSPENNWRCDHHDECNLENCGKNIGKAYNCNTCRKRCCLCEGRCSGCNQECGNRKEVFAG